MGYTNDMNLETPVEGAADWDTSMNANWAILDRGLTFKATAGANVGSGTAVWVSGSGFVTPYDSRSMGLGRPAGFSRYAVASGAAGYFTHVGVVRSMGVNSLIPGLDVFASPAPASLGVMVNCFSGAEYPVGVALDYSSVLVNVRGGRVCPEVVTDTKSGVAYLGTASAFNFSFDLGNRGMVRRLIAGASTVNSFNYKIRLWSGSTRASSELLYETLTYSQFVSSADVTSSYYLDGAGFPYRNTDAASWAMIFGTINVQSGHGATSGSFSITLEVERTR